MPGQPDDRYAPADAALIRNAARRIVRRGFTRDDVDEMVQEVESIAYQRIPRYRPERGSRDKFLSNTAKKLMLNQIAMRRSQKRDCRREVEYAQVPPRSLVDLRDTSRRADANLDLAAALVRMPTDLRQVWLHRRDGHSERDLESLLGCTRAQARTLMRRLKQYLESAKLDPSLPWK